MSMSSKDENILLLKGNSVFNNELIHFKSLEFNEQQFSDHLNEFKINEQDQKYSTYSTYDNQQELNNFNNLESSNQFIMDKSTNESLFTEEMMIKNFNSIFQNQSEDRPSLQINEKDQSFDEETVDYRVEQHIRKFLTDKASSLFMMNHTSDISASTKSTLKKNNTFNNQIDLNKFIKNDDLIDYNDIKKYSTNNQSDFKDTDIDKLFDLNETNTIKNNNDKKLDFNDEMKSNLKKYESASDLKKYSESNSELNKFDLKSKSNYLLNNNDDLKAFENSLLEKYKKISKNNNDKSSKHLYDSTGELNELNRNSSPSSLNSGKSSDLSATIADYSQSFNYLNHHNANELIDQLNDNNMNDQLNDNRLNNSHSNSNHHLKNGRLSTNHLNEIDYLTMKLDRNSIENSKQVNEIEQKLNESRTENLNLMLALENNNTTMKKNLEMAKSLKTELETTKTNFDKYKQQTNLIMENLMNKNKSLNQELTKQKQNQLKLEDEKRKEFDDLKVKNSIELNDLKVKLKDKDEQLKLTTSDLYQCNKKMKEQLQKLTISEQKLDEYEKKLNIYFKELTNQKNKLELNKEEIEIRKRRIQTLEENLSEKLNEIENLNQELNDLREKNKLLEDKNCKLMKTVKQVDIYADKYKIECEKRLTKEKELADLKQALKRVISERDESFKQLDILKTNWKQFQQQTAEQQLQLQQQLTTSSNLDNKYSTAASAYQNSRLSKMYSSPNLNDFYDTSSKMNTLVSANRQQNKHRGQNELLAIEKIEDDKNSLINVLSKQNYLQNLISLNDQLNCNECMLSNSYSQFNTLQMNSSSAKQHLQDHCNDLMNQLRQQNLNESELAFLKNSKKFKKESQKITKLEKKSKSTFSLFNPLMLPGFKNKS